MVLAARPTQTLVRPVTSDNLKPRLQFTATCCPATYCPNEQHAVMATSLPGNKLLVRATCCMYLGNIITIHLCHGRLVSLCIQQQMGNKLATILLPIYKQHKYNALLFLIRCSCNMRPSPRPRGSARRKTASSLILRGHF